MEDVGRNAFRVSISGNCLENPVLLHRGIYLDLKEKQSPDVLLEVDAINESRV